VTGLEVESSSSSDDEPGGDDDIDGLAEGQEPQERQSGM
jgi:hypothetical protein